MSASRDEIKNAIAHLFEPGSVVEVRIPSKTRVGTVSGYFDDHSKLADAIFDADRYRMNIYYTLNPIDPRLLARAYNRLAERAEHTTGDRDILKRRLLPVDVDPIRPAGVSSTNAEHEAAIKHARWIADDMQAKLGRPMIIADSGNGAHILYQIDLPNNATSLRTVEALLATLDERYSTDVLKIDKSVANAARIWKAYGSVARKGDSTSMQPHRIARILEVAG